MERLCNPEGPEVQRLRGNDEHAVQTKIINNWTTARKKSGDFPGPQPVSMERKDLCKLSQFPYMVAEKTDGMRFLMLIEKGQRYLIDRAFRVYLTDTEEKSNKLSILDGELVQETDGTWAYYAHDAVVIEGTSIITRNLTERLARIYEFVSTLESVKAKKMVPFEKLEEFLAEQVSLAAIHAVDGLILTPIDKPVESGTQYSLFKWKTADQQTMDFLVIPKSRRYELWVYDKNELIKYATYSTKTGKGRVFEKHVCTIPQQGSVIECKYYEGNYIPLKARPDKSRPNSLRTIEKTLIGIQENITVDDLLKQVSFIEKVRMQDLVQPYRDPSRNGEPCPP